MATDNDQWSTIRARLKGLAGPLGLCVDVDLGKHPVTLDKNTVQFRVSNNPDFDNTSPISQSYQLSELLPKTDSELQTLIQQVWDSRIKP